MPSALTPEVAHRELTREEVAAALAALLEPGADDTAKSIFLRAWAQRGETASELAASAETLLTRTDDPGVRGSWHGQPLLDCCGTGGGGLNLLNISTGIVFILAAMGIPVVKHGNRGITKKSGSADVLEALGIKIDLQPDQVEACLEKVGAAFLYAPLYHTTFATVAPVRKQLAAEGQRTIFNLLGPLLNPARPDARLVGVFKDEHVPLYFDALTAMKCPRFTVACGEDKTGVKIGEVGAVTLFASTMTEYNGRSDFSSTYWSTNSFSDLAVDGATQSASELDQILSNNKGGLGRRLLILNAAIAARMHTDSPLDLPSFVARAEQALENGSAREVLRKWQDFSAKL
jgi:anthranilate phosphoribosyltransferase